MTKEIKLYENFVKAANLYINEDSAFHREIYYSILMECIDKFHAYKLNNTILSDSNRLALQFLHNANRVLPIAERVEYLRDIGSIPEYQCIQLKDLILTTQKSLKEN